MCRLSEQCASPPTFAFDASRTSRRLNCIARPAANISARCTPICTRQKTKRAGAVRTTAATDPATSQHKGELQCTALQSKWPMRLHQLKRTITDTAGAGI